MIFGVKKHNNNEMHSFNTLHNQLHAQCTLQLNINLCFNTFVRSITGTLTLYKNGLTCFNHVKVK